MGFEVPSKPNPPWFRGLPGPKGMEPQPASSPWDVPMALLFAGAKGDGAAL